MSGMLNQVWGLPKQKTRMDKLERVQWRAIMITERCTGCVEEFRKLVLFSLEKKTLKENNTEVIYCLKEMFC